jgi:hypothetical protein
MLFQFLAVKKRARSARSLTGALGCRFNTEKEFVFLEKIIGCQRVGGLPHPEWAKVDH